MEAGILSGRAIQQKILQGRIFIDPYDPAQINPASYDLTLGKTVAVYAGWTWIDEWAGVSDKKRRGPDGCGVFPHDRTLDIRKPFDTKTFEIDPDRGWVLKPGVGYLMHTNERVCTQDYVAVLDGKSSLGRLFIQVHMTAGYIDPGFDGQYTMEVTVQHPVRVFPGMRIAQVRFHTVVGDIEPYAGHYCGDKARGPVGTDIDAFRKKPPGS